MKLDVGLREVESRQAHTMIVTLGETAPKPPSPRSQEEIMSAWAGDLNAPLVSVVCHTYNHERFIEHALNGFLMQETGFPFEIIINDDASTDGTQAIIRDYQERYPEIITAILHEENQFSKGMSPRNFTFPKVKGRYIALCEGDDYWIFSGKLKAQVNEFYKGVSLVFHDAARVSDDVVIDGSYYKDKRKPENGYGKHQMAAGCKVPTASSMFIAEPFKKAKHENIVNGDHLIWATMAGLGSARYLDKTMSVYRHHVGGIWSSRAAEEKVAPAIKSKLVIFNVVEPELRTAALLGFLATVSELSIMLREAGCFAESRQVLLKGYLNIPRMLFKIRIRNKENIKDLVRIFRIIFLIYPKGIVKGVFAR